MKAEEVKIGMPVVYYSIISTKGEKLLPHETEITSEPWALGHGALVVKCKGISGGVSLNHLVPADQITPEQRIKDAYRAVKFQLRNVKGHINSKGFFAAEAKTDCLIEAANKLRELLFEINDNSQN